MRWLGSHRWAVQAALSLSFIGLALWRADLDGVGEALRRATYGWALLAALLITSSKFVAAGRWRFYLKAVADLPLLGLAGAYLIGTLLNTLLPFRAGDFAKIQIVSSRYGVSRAGLTSSIFVVESALDGFTLLMLLLASMAFLNVGFIPVSLIWVLAFLAGSAFVFSILASRFVPRQMPSGNLRLIPDRIERLMRESWPNFLDGMSTLRDYRLLGKALFLHLTEWMMRVAVLWVLGISFGLDLEFSTYIVLTIALSVGTLMPITFMNIGTYQLIVTEVLSLAGVPRNEAFAYGVMAHALSHLTVIVVGLVALFTMQVRPRQAMATYE